MKKLKKLQNFLKLFYHEFMDKNLSMMAGSLTASTLLSLVPLLMVVFSIVSRFNIFDQKVTEITTWVTHNISPDKSQIVADYLENFINNAKGISGFGSYALILVAMMLMYSVDTNLNSIWHSTKARKIITSIVMYFFVLTVVPVLGVGVFSIGTMLIPRQVFYYSDLAWIKYLWFAFTFIITWFIFSMLYLIIPNTKVLFKHAACGALFAATFFTLGRKVFAWYLITFPSYQIIYGTIATIPILIIWIQWSWLFILIGALFTAVLKQWQQE